MHLLPRILEAVEVAKVLSNTPRYLLAVNVGIVPIDQLLSVFDIFGDGLF